MEDVDLVHILSARFVGNLDIQRSIDGIVMTLPTTLMHELTLLQTTPKPLISSWIQERSKSSLQFLLIFTIFNPILLPPMCKNRSCVTFQCSFTLKILGRYSLGCGLLNQPSSDIYAGVVTCVQTQGGLTKYFPILVGLHQGLALSTYLFSLVMDVFTRHLLEIDFSNVRHLTPIQFVERLSKELRVGGVVAGANYRFGYKASGDAKDLARLCEEYGLYAHIVSPVMNKTWHGSQNGASFSDLGQVSSTRVRHALAMRDMAHVAELLGRKHRLVLVPMNEKYRFAKSTIVAPKSCLLNQPPGDGEFNNCAFLLDDVTVGLCRLAIDSNSDRIELDCENLFEINLVQDGRCIGIEF
ncbi:hypothetical protein KFK09_009501 [Dendrobium nobile]|uniref:FAD synthase n=1 Tax=Dendrobium nobile TaxID=94219 RepID=A0A8T3BK12_DENNO|nr:hypothetical protein KFK09_009501 [Dendrobium nobile]